MRGQHPLDHGDPARGIADPQTVTAHDQALLPCPVAPRHQAGRAHLIKADQLGAKGQMDRAAFRIGALVECLDSALERDNRRDHDQIAADPAIGRAMTHQGIARAVRQDGDLGAAGPLGTRARARAVGMAPLRIEICPPPGA